jgi:hypothetical protein
MLTVHGTVRIVIDCSAGPRPVAGLRGGRKETVINRCLCSAASLRFAGAPVWFVLSTAPGRGSAVTAEPVSAPERESVFLKVADYVSAAMGRPTNIMIWLIAVIAWTAVFAFGGHRIAGGTWLPAWFTSQGFNFPLNLITTPVTSCCLSG